MCREREEKYEYAERMQAAVKELDAKRSALGSDISQLEEKLRLSGGRRCCLAPPLGGSTGCMNGHATTPHIDLLSSNISVAV